MEFENEMKKLIGYRLICYAANEIIASGMFIALYKELKSMKMLVKPAGTLDELELLGILHEPHVKLAHDHAFYMLDEVLDKYIVIGTYDEEAMAKAKPAVDMSDRFFNRFIFLRKHPRRKDRYINFNKVLLTCQRLMFEWCKWVLTGETRALDMTYRCNYSPGRLAALQLICDDYHVQIMLDLIGILKDLEIQSKELLSK